MDASTTNWAKTLRGEAVSGSKGATGTGRNTGKQQQQMTSLKSPLQTSKTVKSKSPTKVTKAPVVRQTSSYNSKKLSPTSRTTKTTVFMEGQDEVIEVHLPLKSPKFDWRVNDENAYFELGTPSEGDDQYVIDITIISASYLHLLGNDQSHNKESYNWTIQYKAFDCDISSDPFQLSNDDESRRTYVGDKATARIRANGGMFCEFLTHTTIEFHAVQMPIIDGTEKITGITCLDLKELAKPNVNELKYILEMVSTNGSEKENMSGGKPEIRVLVQLEADPNFFKRTETSTKRQDEVESIEKIIENIETENGREGGDPKLTTKTKPSVTFQEDIPDSAIAPQKQDEQAVNPESDENNDVYLEEVLNEFHKLKFTDDEKSKTSVKVSPSKGGGDEVRSIVSSDFESNLSPVRKHDSSQVKAAEAERRKIKKPSSNDGITSLANIKPKISPEFAYPLPKEMESTTFSFNSNDSLTDSMEEAPPGLAEGNDIDIVKAGKYRVTIQLNHIVMHSNSPLKSSFKLSYVFPPLGIVDQPVTCTAQPDPSVQTGSEKRKYAVVVDGTWAIVIALSHLSDEILHQPLIVEIRNKKYGEQRPNFLYSNVPFGSIFFQKLSHRKRVLAGFADILKTKGNRKVGIINYVIKLELLEDPKFFEVKAPSVAYANPRGMPDNSFIQKTKLKLENWKVAEEMAFRKTLHEKEKAYLRILSEEWLKRDQERESLVSDKVRSMERRERELEDHIKQIYEKEGTLKALETEVKVTALRNTSEQAQVLETTKFRIRQLEAEHRHEVEILQRRVAESMAEFEKVKGKVIILESKLKNKDDELTEIYRSRNKWPDIEVTMRLDALEKQNEILSQQLMAAQKERDKYKKEANTLCYQLKFKQREQDARLHKENENLKVQLFANEQKMGLNEERQSVKEISEKIKNLLNSKGGGMYCPQQNGKPRGRELKISPNSLQSQETKRSTEMKHLISKGNQTNDDHKFLEKEIDRLVGERSGLLQSGSYSQYDAVVRNIENQITKLASRLNYMTGS